MGKLKDSLITANEINRKTYPDILLSSGRVIQHELQDAGYQTATPTTGNPEMTEDEWKEYQHLFQNKAF